MPASQGWAFHSGHNPKDFSTGSSGYVTLSSSLQLSKRACTGVHTEELGERRAGEGTAREGRGDGENITTGEVLLKKPPPIRRPLILLAPTVLPCGPLSHPYLGKRGRGEGGRAVSTFQQKSRDDRGYITMLGRHSDKDSLQRRCFLLPSSFSYLNSHMSKLSHPQDTRPSPRVHGTGCLFVQG